MTVHLIRIRGTLTNVPRPKSNRDTKSIRRLIAARLVNHVLEDSAAVSATGAHPDEDALNSFIEGRLSERESAPFISHLIACGLCRRITAQLTRLDSELDAFSETVTSPSAEDEPGRLRRFLADLAARVLDSSEDDAVFAYHAPAEDFQRPEDVDKAGESQADSKPDQESGSPQ